MKRREFLQFCAAAAAGGCASGAMGLRPEGSEKKKPNVILVFIDDLGYADFGCCGSQDLRTPNIDRLAAEGARFTQGYVTASICCPSRAGLLTGRYQQRFGHEDNTGDWDKQVRENIGLPLSQITIADALKKEGYATGIIGKWHQGVNPHFHPQNRGFDEFFGHLAGGHDYFKWDQRGDDCIYRGKERAQGEGYLTEAFSGEAVSFIERHRDEPFFLFVSYNAVHTPMQVPQKYPERFPEIADERRRTFAGMLSCVDDGVGQILRVLEENGNGENTLIFCISDNGGPTGANTSRNDPLRGAKGTMHEGGIRVPFLMRFPGKIPAGMVYDKPVSTLDLFPTSIALAGGTLPDDREYDGVNLMPYLTGEKTGRPHETLYWRQVENKFAIRKGDWKLLLNKGSKMELFDLSSDIGESHDLYELRPEVAKDLFSDFSRWSNQMAEPLWRKAAKQPAPAGNPADRPRTTTGR
jgi:arylsulfatase A-like enzyme